MLAKIVLAVASEPTCSTNCVNGICSVGTKRKPIAKRRFRRSPVSRSSLNTELQAKAARNSKRPRHAAPYAAWLL